MTIEDIENELKSYKNDWFLIKSMEEQVAFYEAKLTACTSQISDTTRGSSAVHDKIAEYIARIEELQIEKYTRLIELENKLEVIEKTVDKLKQPYKTLLFITYIQESEYTDECGQVRTIIGHKNYETAYIMSYDPKYFSRLHRRALWEYKKEREKCIV